MIQLLLVVWLLLSYVIVMQCKSFLPSLHRVTKIVLVAMFVF